MCVSVRWSANQKKNLLSVCTEHKTQSSVVKTTSYWAASTTHVNSAMNHNPLQVVKALAMLATATAAVAALGQSIISMMMLLDLVCDTKLVEHPPGRRKQDAASGTAKALGCAAVISLASIICGGAPNNDAAVGANPEAIEAETLGPDSSCGLLRCLLFQKLEQ